MTLFAVTPVSAEALKTHDRETVRNRFDEDTYEAHLAFQIRYDG